MDNNLSESKRNLSRAPQETELGSVPVSQWPSLYKKQVRNLEFQLKRVSRGRVRPPLLISMQLCLLRNVFFLYCIFIVSMVYCNIYTKYGCVF